MRRLLVLALVVTGFVVAGPADATGVPRTLAATTPVTAAVIDPAFPVDYVGLIWDGAHAASPAGDGGSNEAKVRFRHGDRWSSWQPFVEDGVEAEGQYASGLVRGDDADAYQVVVPPTAARPRAVAINTTDGPRTRTSRSAEAATTVVSRAQWGADESLMTWQPEYHGPAQKLTVHHTATTNNDPDPAATVRAVYRYHAVDRGFGDIGYHLLVDEGGRVYEGRYSGVDGDPAHESTLGTRVVTGAHVGGYNSANLGVAALGTLTERGPTAPAQSALEDVLSDWSRRHGIAPTGSGTYTNPVSGATWTGPNIPGHRDFAATECPGGALYALLPTIRSNVAARLASSPPPTTPIADTTAPTVSNVTASTTSNSATVRWTTDEPATSEVRYRVDGSTTIQTATVSGSRTSHEVTLSGLRAKTRYRFSVISADASGNRTQTAEQTFTTKR